MWGVPRDGAGVAPFFGGSVHLFGELKGKPTIYGGSPTVFCDTPTHM